MNLSRRDLLKSTALGMGAAGMSGCMSVGDGKESINFTKKHDISLKFMIEPTYCFPSAEVAQDKGFG